MKGRSVVLLGALAVAGWAAAVWAEVPGTDFETVKQRMVAEARVYQTPLEQVPAWVTAQRSDGSWSDIDYASHERTLWVASSHLIRLLALAQAIVSDPGAASRRAALCRAFVRGFDYWLARDPQSANWWQNEIGAPQLLYRAMLVGEPLLTDGRRERGCALLARAKLGMTGQNLVWMAENVIGRACLTGDSGLMSQAFQRMEDEIVITENEGIQADFSFHQHGAQLYSGGYGNGFAASVVRFAGLADGTAFAFAPEKIKIIESYLLDGQQWMIRGQRFDYSAVGRELTRPNSARAAAYSTYARNLLKLGAVTRREELTRFAERVGSDGAKGAFSGHRHFWRSDYTVHQRPEWMVSVRLTSSRLQQTEIINEENLLGEHLSDGVTYFYRTGDEYRDIFPVWDWTRLPGITAESGRPIQRINNRRRGSRAFAGGVSDGRNGVSAMDFERDGLEAKKAWFFFDSMLLCLGAGITSTNDNPVITSINQCLAHGSAMIKRADGKMVELGGVERFEKPEGVCHNGIGYRMLSTNLVVQAGTAVQTGSWRCISRPRSDATVSNAVFSLGLEHGRHPTDARYAYAVAPVETPAAWDAFLSALPPLRLLANTPRVQAVERLDGQLLMAVFYESGEIGSVCLGRVSVDAPCLLMIRRTGDGDRLMATVCDPRNVEGTVRLSVGGRHLMVTLPKGSQAGASVSQAL